MSLKSSIQWLIDFVMRRQYRFPHKIPNPNPVKTDFRGHYATVNHNHSDDNSYITASPGGKTLWQPNLVGIQFRVHWNALEPTKATSVIQGNPGYTYDFSRLSQVLAECATHNCAGANGKCQFIPIIEDKVFYAPSDPLPQDAFPDYLFNEGFTTTRCDSTHATSGSFRSNPYVSGRFVQMLQAMANYRDANVPNGFDAHPNFEGITIQETAIGDGDWPAAGGQDTLYTPARYVTAINALIAGVNTYFPKSRCFQFINFITGGQTGKPNSFDDVLNYMVSSTDHAVFGGPDVLHDGNSGTLTKAGANPEGIYQYYEQFKDSLEAAGSMQNDSYREVKSTGPTVYYTMEEQFYLAASLVNPATGVIETTRPSGALHPAHKLYCSRVMWDFRNPQGAESDWSDACRVITAHPEFNSVAITKF